ncbi:MAG TPA: 3'-5' exonuclease [Candidatus Binatia bacterium]|nr:3'-5' exonuclease [Candidatus Binatia bacterium]
MESVKGISDRLVSETPVAVVDLETTGLYPGGDRIVELAVVRIDPGQRPELVLDTLINPGRPISATEIHGISEEDVVGAPSFEDVAGNLASVLTGCVFASYNVYFDAKFVQAELAQIGVSSFPPHLCLMYMRPLLGIGPKCSLTDACRFHNITYPLAHQAAADAMASALLWQLYTSALGNKGIRTFGDLAKLKSYKFTKSFAQPLLDQAVVGTLRSTPRLKSRTQAITRTEKQRQPDRSQLLAEYWDALTAILADLTVTQTEIRYLQDKLKTLSLHADELRWLHARAFSGILADLSQDKAITSSEAQTLHEIVAALRQLGWAPGDSDSGPAPSASTAVIMAKPKERGWSALVRWFGHRRGT